MLPERLGFAVNTRCWTPKEPAQGSLALQALLSIFPAVSSHSSATSLGAALAPAAGTGTTAVVDHDCMTLS